MKLKEVNQCPQCGSSNIIYSGQKDEIICKDCGAITSELTPDMQKKLEKASEVLKE